MMLYSGFAACRGQSLEAVQAIGLATELQAVYLQGGGVCQGLHGDGDHAAGIGWRDAGLHADSGCSFGLFALLLSRANWRSFLRTLEPFFQLKPLYRFDFSAGAGRRVAGGVLLPAGDAG
jgi:hypothetical protein